MLAYGEIERAVVMHLEFRQAKAHMASLQVEVKLKFNHRKVDLHPSINLSKDEAYQALLSDIQIKDQLLLSKDAVIISMD